VSSSGPSCHESKDIREPADIVEKVHDDRRSGQLAMSSFRKITNPPIWNLEHDDDLTIIDKSGAHDGAKGYL
jgi:hypothetical protein